MIRASHLLRMAAVATVLVVSVLTVAAAKPLTGQTASGIQGTDSGPLGIPGTWVLKFDSEFSGSSLDRSQWTPGWFGSGITPPVDSREVDCYDSSQLHLGGANLAIQLVKRQATCGGLTKSYTSGLISSNGKYSFTYGAMEARIRVPLLANGELPDWPAFWATGQSWPRDGEIDVMEGYGNRDCETVHEASGQGLQYCQPTSQDNAGTWHTYAADWEPGSVSFYIDGALVATETTGITSAPMYLILNLAAASAEGGPVTAPTSLLVSFVRVWQHPERPAAGVACRSTG